MSKKKLKFTKNTKLFWKTFSNNNFKETTLMNLEPNIELSRKKRNYEKQKIFKLIKFNKNDIVLDFGCGTGIWSQFFSKKVKKVYAVEPSKKFIEIFKNKKNLTNIKIIHGNYNKIPKIKFTKIFLSGVTIYMSDLELKKLLQKIFNVSHKNSAIIHRDSYALKKKIIIDNKYSNRLSNYYSAVYRTNNHYIKIFKKNGFKIILNKDMYKKNSILNIWQTTRIGLRVFQKICNS